MADSRLQKSPYGLLGGLDLKQLGENPTLFADVLAPVFDCLNQYLLPNQIIVGQATTITGPAVSAVATFTVPQGKVWRVGTVGHNAILAAGDAALTANSYMSIASPGNVSVMMYTAAAFQKSGTAIGRGVNNIDPLWLSAGWSIGLAAYLSAAPATPTVFANGVLCQEFDA